MGDEPPISFSKHAIRIKKEERLQQYRDVIEHDLQRDIEKAKELLEENGYTVTVQHKY
jgi:tRNA1(Val) A37 N6-methylase TrmN6|tara:strand:+ start:278 stop:451 length:174 start_codon:yes stop_codon:yes gene_type:complete